MPFRRVISIALVAALGLAGCYERETAGDPDRHEHAVREDRAAFEARLRAVSLPSVVAAVAGTTVRDAPVTLEQWLTREPDAATLLRAWPRAADGALDLRRAPVSASSVSGTVAPGGSSRCGEVVVVFRGAAGPSLRFRLPLPATSRTCRAARNGAPLRDGEALDALNEAIAGGIVPDLSTVAPTAIGGGLRE